MSLRAELVRLGLRWFVKRKIGPATTLEALRRQDAFLERLVPPSPKGTQATHVDLDGVKAVAVVTPASLGGRLVLYLHGGGHVSGSPALYGDFTWRIAAASSALNLRYNSLPHVPRIGLRHRPTSPKANQCR
jgi:epsilon-lactone hydrolase